MSAAGEIPSPLKRIILISLIGNGLEWYDFAIFGYFAPIFSKQFFPAASPFIALINTFAVFAVGFLSRPLGAYIFGKMGDQHGRKKALLCSMFIMACTTSLMGLLPTYDSIGILAPILLVIFRIFQGISLGGEFTGSLSFVIEHTPPSRRGLVGAIAYSGGFLGGILGATVGAFITVLFSSSEIQAWGWRIPFLLGFMIAFLGFYLRSQVEETPAFLELKRRNAIDANPLKSIKNENSKEIFQLIFILLPNTTWVYLFVFLSTYFYEIKHWDFSYSFLVNSFPPVLALIFIPIGGHLSDIWGRKKIILIGQAGLFMATPFAFKIFSEGVFTEIILVQIVISAFLALSCGPIAALLTEMFPTRLRNTGMALSYHIATGVFGGMTPLILTSLTSFLGMESGPIALLSLIGILGLAALISIKESGLKVMVEQ